MCLFPGAILESANNVLESFISCSSSVSDEEVTAGVRIHLYVSHRSETPDQLTNYQRIENITDGHTDADFAD